MRIVTVHKAEIVDGKAATTLHYRGRFHGYTVDTVAHNQFHNPVLTTVAIVEDMLTGGVDLVSLHLIKFENPGVE